MAMPAQKPATPSLFKKFHKFLSKNIEVTLKTLQVISIICGGGYFIVQYRNTIIMEQKKQTLQYAEKFLDKTLAGSLLDLDRPFQSESLKPAMDVVLRASLKTGDICPIKKFYSEKFLGGYYKTAEEKSKFYSTLSSLIGGFESLAICVNSGTCDLDIACNFFFDQAIGLLTDHCVELDRYVLQFGYSPARETEKFLNSCSMSSGFSRKVTSLTYCESIRKKAALLHNLASSPPAAQIEALYKSCPFAADATQ